VLAKQFTREFAAKAVTGHAGDAVALEQRDEVADHLLGTERRPNLA
jgi:hypothetical protein